MALNIKDQETERLVARLAEQTGETKTAAVRQAVMAQLAQIDAAEAVQQRKAKLTRLLEDEIWPLLPSEELGKPLTKEEQEEILGIGPDGI
jgi:antitoxin VapB